VEEKKRKVVTYHSTISNDKLERALKFIFFIIICIKIIIITIINTYIMVIIDITTLISLNIINRVRI